MTKIHTRKTAVKALGVKNISAKDLRGASQLVVDAVLGVTDIVEGMHRNIGGLAPIVGAQRTGRTKGITGFVYKSVRGVTRAVGAGLDVALALVEKQLGGEGAPSNSARSEAVRAAINGVFGDYLDASHNPLAISMSLRQNGLPISPATQTEMQTQGKLLVLVHGLCMNDLQWLHSDGGAPAHDHGAALAQELNYAPVYLHFNSGKHISINGREFADALQALVSLWPVPVTDIVILGHSMGGLVARSACFYAEHAGLPWRAKLRSLICLGAPHHGAPLERAGKWVDTLLSVSPYSAPLARLGLARSAGIKDLRHGNVIDEHWQGSSHSSTPDRSLPLPRNVACYAIAASSQTKPASASSSKSARGDGLVPLDSALGHHKNAAFALGFPAAHQHVVYGIDHFQLLSSAEVYAQLYAWLKTS